MNIYLVRDLLKKEDYDKINVETSFSNNNMQKIILEHIKLSKMTSR
jgi:hypothetical protein